MNRRTRLVASVALGVSVLSAAPPDASAAPSWPSISTPPRGMSGDGAHDSALIVGIERYTRLASIPGAAANAQDWYQFLVEGRKIPADHVSLVINDDASRDGILDAASEVAREVQPGGTLWVIFIGHGAPAADGKEGVLVGVDARQTVSGLYGQSVKQSELAAAVGKGKQAHTVMVYDACFSGRGGDGAPLAPGLQPTIALMSQRQVVDQSTTVLSAGARDQFAGPLPGAARPAFSYLLLGALRGWGDENHDGVVTTEEAFEYARRSLGALRTAMGRTQTPEMLGSDSRLALARNVRDPGPSLAALVVGASGGGAPVGVTHPPTNTEPSQDRRVAPAGAHDPVMLPVEAGRFWMGSADGDMNERPVHQVALRAFMMDRTEVTVAEYAACVVAGGCQPAPTTVEWPGIREQDRVEWSGFCNGNRSDRQNHPINCVDWSMAEAYCRWAGGRLPTEAEWEYAARGPESRLFPWGNDAPSTQLCWNRLESKSGTCAVGSFATGTSPFGLVDMAGNVYEWTASGYVDDYTVTHPGPARVSRGGSWLTTQAQSVRSSTRNKNVPTQRYGDLGFRCAR